jgi:hypothetical protein
MGDLRRLQPRREFFLDDRGHGLQLAWDPSREVVIVSIWRDDRCVGTVRLPVAEVPRAGGFLMAALNDWVGRVAPPKDVLRQPDAELG